MADSATFRLELHDKPGYLHARGTGAHTPENAAFFLNQAYLACLEKKLDSLLLEMAFSGPSLGPGSIYSVVSRGSPDGMKLRRIAYVDSSQRDPEKMKFAENVARNRGVNVRLFASVADAERWMAQE